MAENPTPVPTDKNGSSKDASPFTAPQISLPKGGGAIHGIGEKFTTNPVTGTGSMTIPIALSPGRSSFGPQLSLSYDSGTGYGPFGMGWSLSSPAITRKTDKGLPQYRDSQESDVFILSGSEDLVPVLQHTGPAGWIELVLERDGYRVKQYRPRIEGLFARIERWTRIVDGDVHWRSISKDNVLTVYGEDALSRIGDPAHPDHVFSWLISATYDDKGNAIVYEYAAENDHGVDLTAANERNRVRTANRYVKRIRYGNRRPLLLDPDVPSFRRPHTESSDLDSADWMFEVVFDYDDGHYHQEPPDDKGQIFVRASATPAPGSSWPARKDAFSTYRSTFEVRTYRLCRRVLMFHHFPEELGVAEYLVRSTEFEYRQKPFGSFITRVTQSGYRLNGESLYLKKSLPPLDLDYTASPLEGDEHPRFEVQDVDPGSLANLPEGIDGKAYRFIDLDGEGISGVFSEQGGAWFYKPNRGNARFGTTETLPRRPSLAAISGGRQQFMALAGDGKLDLVDLSSPTPGFYERTLDAGWGMFCRFHSLPIRDWKDANLRFVDVTGDGLTDVLITQNDAFTWHAGLSIEGFGPAGRVPFPVSEEKGPRVVFADGTQSIYLADMSGDGLSDLVRIRNREVCYWPNLGYGRFGAKVTMDNAPWFDDPDLFDQDRIRLADTDGLGTTDIVYLGRDSIRIYLNEVGNRWSDARVVNTFPLADNLAEISVEDLLGHGTACLLWSSPLPGDATRSLRYIDLMRGQKPHLLKRVVNNLGAETVIEYGFSTEFYLADKAAGTPWVTKLAFPVHVVKRVETYDFISRNRFVTVYSYHHGYFDGPEREFRGFGRVDQLDTEEFGALTSTGAFPAGHNEDRASNVPPVLTKTWFHTGAFLGIGRITRYMAHEYYREPLPPPAPGEPNRHAAMELDDTILSELMSSEESREACRALKGTMLRQEVYALDGTEESPRPYSVAESNSTIMPLQPRFFNRHAVFFTHPRETVTFQYERKLYDIDGVERADPRVGHNVALRVDDYGNVMESVSIGYGRRYADSSGELTETDRSNQSRTIVTLTENRYTNIVDDADAYRTPVPAESRTYELIHLAPSSREPGITNLFRFDELAEKVACASDGAHDLPYDDFDAAGALRDAPYRRLIEENRSYYRADRLDRILLLGVAEALALPGQSYKLASTRGLLAEVYRRTLPSGDLIPDVPHVLLHEGKYADIDGDGRWWSPSGRLFYAPHECDSAVELEQAREHFFAPRRFVDPFHNATVVALDPHDLMPDEIRDAIGNIVRAEIDYRMLATWRVMDPNRNRTAVAFDALGMVVGSAVMGKPGQPAGDTLDEFVADLGEEVILEHITDPLRNPHSILQQATTRLVYDLFAYDRTRHDEQPQPATVYTLARETHVADLQPGKTSKVQHAFTYSDGFSREIQRKMQAEPGPIADGGPDVNPRWVGSGWTIFNNKGNPVRKYEPFFSATHAFQFANKAGVSSILFYDPAQRVVATLHADHTYEKVLFDPWRQATWDVNDTVLQSNPAQDPDVGDFFVQIPPRDYLPTWFEQRKDGQLGKEEQQAAAKTSVHANTPNVAYLDSLGRTFVAIVHNRFEREGVLVDEHLATRTVLDIKGNQIAVIDPLDRVVMRSVYDIQNARLRQVSVDSGTRWMVNDSLGKLMLLWDSRAFRVRHDYDVLHRPTTLHVRKGDGAEVLAERIIYGEGQPNDQALNLRSKGFRQFDGAGIVTNERYDFKGNLLATTRQLLEDYKNDVDWLQSPELESVVFTTATTYDALNRPITLTTPDASVARPHYNEANLLESLSVHLRGADEPTPFVTYINYNAKGQRETIAYGNGAHTRYSYDPLTFRMTHLVTIREEDRARLQDLNYTFDPVGNITSICDDAQQTVFFRNHVVSPSNSYVYDAIYRLIAADGREHAGKPGRPQTTFDDGPRMHQPLPSNGHAMHRYREQYNYDGAGNILKLLHSGFDANWSRFYSYEGPHDHPRNNRLTSARVGHNAEHYSYDAAGNMTRMPHLPQMQWDFKNQLHASRRQEMNAASSDTTYYVYDSAGERVRKVTERASGSRKHERVYLGRFEIFREFDNVGATRSEHETLHVMDDKRRVALVESVTKSRDGSQSRLIRYQFGNHLESALLELDEGAELISYEEYYPYGSTSYEAVNEHIEASAKRYRYTGKERDEETGLAYHGARYYAPWLARWTAADPSGLRDGSNLYCYTRNSPIRLTDQAGTDGNQPPADDQKRTTLTIDWKKGHEYEESTQPAPGGTAAGTTTKKYVGVVGHTLPAGADPNKPAKPGDEKPGLEIDPETGNEYKISPAKDSSGKEGDAPPTRTYVGVVGHSLPPEADPNKGKEPEDKPHLEIQPQTQFVLNQPGDGQRSFFSTDVSVGFVAKDYNVSFCTSSGACFKPAISGKAAELTFLHEPAAQATVSFQVKNPADSHALTPHPEVSAQIDLVNLTFKRNGKDFVELKATGALQYDAKQNSAQAQIQPGVEIHATKKESVVFGAQWPVDLATGRGSPPAFGVGVLGHF
jgi:RHS repeat-associated protein